VLLLYFNPAALALFKYPQLCELTGLFPCLRWGKVFLERTRILSVIQFTRYFIEFVLVETKRFVASNVNDIVIRYTCRQHTKRVAGSKYQALALYLSIRICYMRSCSEDQNLEVSLGLCTTSGLAKRMQLRSAEFRSKTCSATNLSKLLSLILFANPEVVHRPRQGFECPFLRVRVNNCVKSVNHPLLLVDNVELRKIIRGNSYLCDSCVVYLLNPLYIFSRTFFWDSRLFDDCFYYL